MEIIKKTTSVCPECLRMLSAEVRADADGVFLVRHCPLHGRFSNLVEKDIDFYKRAANIKRKRYAKDNVSLILPITDQCNLQCKFCFFPNRHNYELPPEKILDIARSFSGTICLSGGEPTLHSALAQIIRELIQMGKEVELLTNGLKIADASYLMNLKSCGLNKVIFSLNGFDDAVLNKIDGRPLCDIKRKALKNLKELNIKTEFSISLLRGVNEDELKKAIQYCLENNDYIIALRVRSFSQVGRSLNIPTLTIGEMLDILAAALSVDKADLIRGLEKSRQSAAMQYNARLIFYSQNGKPEFLAALCNQQWGKLGVLFKIIKTRGIKVLLRVLFNKVIGRGEILPLILNVWSWPDRNSLDLEEINSHGVTHLNQYGRMENFFRSLILDYQY